MLISTASCALAQAPSRSLDDVKKRDQRTLREARQAFDFGEYAQARPALDALIERYPDIPRLYYMRAITQRQLGRPDAAIGDLQRGIELEGEADNRVYRELGELYSEQQDYAAAVTALERYRNGLATTAPAARIRQADQLLASARLGVEMLANPQPFSPERLAGGVNTTAHHEYFPSLSIDGERLIFTRNLNRNNEDFYESTRLEDGSWGPATPLSGVNTDLNEAAQTITADGRLLVFTACDRPNGIGGCDLYLSERRDGRWTPARNLGPGVNSRFWDSHPSISSDGQLLFFASKRGGGEGKSDLYVSARRGDGTFAKPINLGPVVNTPEDDVFPFWAADGKTLFFTSTGHPGLGGADLFRTVLEGNSWTAPANLGYPINTSGEETNLFITLDGRTAYYSASAPGNIDDAGVDVDIYRFELPPALRPTPATYLRVRVTDAATGAPLQASVRLQKETGPVATRFTSPDGSFLTVLPAGTNYSLTVDQPGYLYYADRFLLEEGFAPDDPFLLDVRLQPVGADLTDFPDAEADGAIVLKNVFFETGKADLLESSANELDRLAELLERQPALAVEIAGHTDDVGSEADNQRLSERRAAAVAAYLTGRGIASGRVSTVGYGEQRPVASNDTTAGRAQNRRTTFRLLRQ